MMSSYILLAAGVLILGSLAASRFVSRIGVPSLLATLGVGLLFGNGGRFDFYYNYPSATLHVSEMALSIILFAAGFESNWKKIRPVFGQGVALATIGVFVTMIVVGAFTHWVLHWSWLQSLLMGAVVSSTDAAAVFSILESSKLKLKSGVREVLELESGANDPMGFFLTLSFCGLLLAPDQPISLFALGGNFLVTMGVGLITGLLAGKAMLFFVQKFDLKRGQSAVGLFAWLLILFAINAMLGGSVFLAMYIAGVVLGNAPWVQRDISLNFFEGLSWLMETALFLLLGLQVNLFELDNVIGEGLLIALVLIFIARPAGVKSALVFFRGVEFRTKVFYAWVGLRGATPIVFALIPVVQHVPDAYKIFNISFIVVIASMLLQGTTVSKVAGLTGINVQKKVKDV